MYIYIYMYICFYRGMLERCFRNTGDQKGVEGHRGAN